MSGNFRPFKEDPTSYRKTGIPCGDPSRIDSRGVIRMAPSSRPFKAQNMEAPVEDIETEGERQLHKLAKQQMETNVFKAGKLVRRKEFTPSNLLNPATAKVSGSLTIDNYRKLEHHDKHMEELRQYGLTEDEIQLLLETEGIGLDGKPSKRSRFGVNPDAHASKLEHIKRKIERKKQSLTKPDKIAGAKIMSRHELDLERAISKHRDKSKLLGMLVTKMPTEDGSWNPNDPINNLDTVMTDALREERKKRLFKRREPYFPIATCGLKPDGFISRRPDPQGPICPLCRLPLKTDETEDKMFPLTKDETEASKMLSRDMYAKCSCVILEPTSPQDLSKVEGIKEEHIVKDRLSVEEIRELPRFKDYEPGLPNKVLFLKNMVKQVTEVDLAALFNRFTADEGTDISYKLMTGRMKGQAFVTFKDADTATKGLDLANGYKLKGKPIIIQYGKHKFDS